MGTNVYNYNRHHNNNHQAAAESSNNGDRKSSRSASLPMLCSRNSIKDVVAVPIPTSGGGGSRAAPFSGGENEIQNENEDPLSPKIGCMGQVKRNNRIGGFPASSSGSSSYSSVAAKFIASHHPPPLPAVKYLKLKRVFSAKNLTTTATASSSSARRSAAAGEVSRINSKSNSVDPERSRHTSSSSSFSSSDAVAVNIEEIDPPLPVMRSKRFETAAEGSLWERRRSGRMGLKNLEVQGIVLHQQQIPEPKFQPTTA